MKSDSGCDVQFCIVALATIVLGGTLGEFLRRIALYWEESYHLETRYQGSKKNALMASLSLSGKACVAYGCSSLVCMVTIVELASSYSVCFTVVIPCYCIIHLLLHLFGQMRPRESYLQKLDEMQLSFGHVFAWQHYFGYLKIILPDFLERVKEFERDSGVEIFRRLFILLPESCYLPSDLSKHEADEDSIQFVRNLKAVIVDRNGIKNRTYTNPVYRITTSTGDRIYCCMEGAAILNSLYEMCEEKKVSEEKKHQNRIEFVATLQKILNDDCMGNLIELVSYKDIDERGNQVKISSVIQQRVGTIMKNNRRHIP